MHVMAINGSPRNETSSTNLILTPLLEGMRSSGATTEVVHLGKLHINHCLGCFLCWVRTPGKCPQKDDMNDVLERFRQADLLVFGTPLYHYHMSGLMKNFIDRTLPLHKPWLVADKEHPSWSMHPDRYPRERSMLLVSPCGFPEFDYFTPMVQYFQFLAKKLKWRYLGEILRPEGELLRTAKCQEMIGWYYDLLRQAGSELISKGSIPPGLQTSLRKYFTPGGPEVFRQMANKQWMEDMRKFGVDDCPPEGAG